MREWDPTKLTIMHTFNHKITSQAFALPVPEKRIDISFDMHIDRSFRLKPSYDLQMQSSPNRVAAR